MQIYPPGALINGRYEVAGRPLRGGMGVVYLCFDHEEQRPVALKTFKPEYLPNRAVRDRFLREGATWVNLGRHSHIVRCYQVVNVGLEIYLVLELVAKEHGCADASLRSWLLPGRLLRVEQTLLFGLQITRGMIHATETIPGFVHRDLKPENVLVGRDRLPSMGINRVRVTDFGLAAVLKSVGVRTSGGGETLRPDLPQPPGVSGLRRTQLTQGVVGTPLYMAPEQWKGDRVTVQADMYALGCILYEMLSGQPAAGGERVVAVERAHCAGVLRQLPMGLPIAVREVVARCLALEPESRYSSWGAVEETLSAAYLQVTGKPAPGPESVQALNLAERVAVGWSYGAMGDSYLNIGKLEVALKHFEQARDVGRTAAEPWLEATGLTHVGIAYFQLGKSSRAIRCSEEALALWRKIGDRGGERGALMGLGNVYLQLGKTQQAIRFYGQSLAIAREVGDRAAEANCLGNLGNAYFQLGNMQEAIKFLKQQVLVAREIGDRRGEGNGLGNLGLAYRNLGDTRQAIRCYEQALAIAREIGNRRGEGDALGNLGTACLDLGDTRRAIECHQQALTISREIRDGFGVARDSVNLAISMARAGRRGEALQLAEQAVRKSERAGYPQLAEQAQRLVAQIQMALSKSDEQTGGNHAT